MTSSVALLVVHGIGSQRPGEALADCAASLKLAYPAAALLDRNGAAVTPREISTRKLDEAMLCQRSWQIHLYEVYWANLLTGPDVDASFNKFLFEETTWFPWFNWKAGLLPHAQYSRLQVWGRTAQMWLLALAATIIYELVPKKVHGTILDQIVADVWNYTHSLGGSLPADSPIHGAGEAIIDCFRQTVRRARQDGCGEVQIVAHSLGTVVAYNALTRYPSPGSGEGLMPITHLYTIGSPLEKFLFIWTRLLRPSLPSPEIQIDGVTIAAGPEVQWKNFYSPWDLVSGKLKRFQEWGQVENKRLWRLGGLARAHISYFRSTAFIADLTASLGGQPQPVKTTWREGAAFAMTGVAESLLLPVAVVLALLLGIMVFLLAGAIYGAIAATLLYAIAGWPLNALLGHFGMHIGFTSAVHWTVIVCAALMIPGIIVFITKDGYLRARSKHYKFWT